MARPIGHMIPRQTRGTGWGDSCLHAAGGFSFNMHFWWYFEWPTKIRARTLKSLKNNKDGIFISINALEYAALVLNYIASLYYLVVTNSVVSDPNPIALLYVDNTTSKAWVKKGRKSSLIGRALGHIQEVFMMNSPMCMNSARIATKDSKVADRISCILTEANLSTDMLPIFQDFPSLWSCTRFQPGAELILLVLDTLLKKNSIDPLLLSRRIMENPGKTITSSFATIWNSMIRAWTNNHRKPETTF